jgi:hypothetical protein
VAKRNAEAEGDFQGRRFPQIRGGCSNVYGKAALRERGCNTACRRLIVFDQQQAHR